MSENDNRFDWPNSNGGECPLCGMSCSASNTPDDVFGADIECNDCSFSCSDVDLNTAKYKTDLAAAQAEVERLTVRTKTLEMLLADYTSWKPEKGVIPKVSMTHGTCCCCRECGQNHDDCVCTHNEIATALATIATDKEKNIVPTIEEMTGLIDYGGRVIFEDGEPMVIPMPEGAKR